ncbi:hypothetical protein SLEP1_g10233 [Rubroshorea leprosula]|uniref:AAA+ ATPase domain-containing protein n=1 Tax=Rubroshorea leprosula TaxID=152421 RepID=A0AAV5IFZ2_9ROSI|nr:hypothetical protein SLEP1_g10233 [Rubroshorea leprosula]
MVMTMGEMYSYLGSGIATLMFINAIIQQYFPLHLRGYIERYSQKFVSILFPYVQISFDEFTGDSMSRSEAFSAIRNYLSDKSSTHAKRLKADVVKDSRSLILSMDYNEEVTDEFEGVKVWWTSTKNVPEKQYSFSWYPASDEKRYYKLIFHRRDRKLITDSYISHVMKEGDAIAVKNRQRKLYTNNPGESWSGHKRTRWTHVVFKHPATFDTLAMETKKKEEIIKDLIKFSKGKQYYSRIGKAWKRGYLLYGPPGTGKSSMIAAIANFLNYDVYDLELTTVKDNTDLRRLLIETSSKSVIVIEDIDCSLDLTGQREKKKKKEKDEDEEGKDPVSKKAKEAKEEEKKESKVTLSGLLNCVDGLWSACGEEKIIVFTTNYVEKLDPALIRRGRMDKHIEMSYCCFEAFKVLAKNYLDIDSHPQYEEIHRLLEETSMTPADVAESLMPKSDEDDEDTCLKALVEALEAAKEEARKKAEEEARLKSEEEVKEKEEVQLKAEKEETEKEKARLKAEREKEESPKENGKLEETPAKEVKDDGLSH